MPTQDSRDAFAYIDQGDALQKQGRFEQAIESYDAAIALQPANDTAHLNRGVALRASGKVEAAIDSYDRAIAAQPDNPLAHLNRGNALAQLGRRTEADQSYGAAAALRPDDPEIWLNRSNNLMRMGRYEAGIASYDRLIALDPGQADLHANRAAAFRALGNVAEADAGFKRAIAIDPDHFAARFGLAFDTLLLGDLGRSFLLRLFEGLSAVPGVRLISVHKGEGASQLESLPDGMRVQDAAAQFDSGRDGLLDAAAVIALCDLVITSDTAIAHLAGALGAPAWLALKRTPDWRWMMERPDSPWYPSLRLYRQPVDGDWDSVFAAMERDLRAMLA